MNMERSSFVAIGLCVIFYLGYTQYLSHKYPQYYAPKTTAGSTQHPQDTATPSASGGTNNPITMNAAAPTTAAINSSPSITKLSAADLTIETDTNVYHLNQDLSGFESIKLKSYKDKLGPDSGPIELLAGPLVLQGAVKSEQAEASLGVFHAERQGRAIKFWREEAPWRIEQEFKFPDTGYAADIVVSFQNTSGSPVDLNATLLQQSLIAVGHASSSNFLIPGAPMDKPRLLVRAGSSDDFIDAEKYCEDNSHAGVAVASDKIDFFGFDNHYFLTAFTPKVSKLGLSTYHVGRTSKDRCVIGFRVTEPSGLVQPGEKFQLAFSGYFGPKVTDAMAIYNPTYQQTLGLGWLDVLAHPLLFAIKGFHQLTGNYGIAIIVLTLMLKILFYPLTSAAAVSMHKMKKLNPEMTALREKYKSDPQTQQRELMKFWQQHKINPMKGCLPILPQIPVFFAFYRVLSASIELRHAPFFGWIKDLSVADPYYVTPILLGVGMFVQQKLTPMTGVDKTQEKILMMMPIIFSVMMLTLPSGMVLYMLTNTIVSILQQQWLNRKLNNSNN